MAMYAVDGMMGSGKTYSLVNRFIPEFLRKSKRKIYYYLPIEREALIHYCARNHADLSEFADRLVPLVGIPKDGMPWGGKKTEVREIADEDGRVTKESVTYDPLREFWFEMEPGSVAIVDEAADIWNSLDRTDRVKTLQSAINHQRHYQFDWYLCCQDRNDFDTQIRSKIGVVIHIENSTTLPMFKGVPALRGLRWPWQFFFVKHYLGKNVLNRRGDLSKFECLSEYSVWPSKRGFKNYRSFSRAATLAGMKGGLPAAGSSDLQSSWHRFSQWLRGAWYPVAFILGLLLFVVLAMNTLIWLGKGCKRPWYHAAWPTASEGKAAAVPATAAAATAAAVGTNGLKLATATAAATNAVRKMILITSKAAYDSMGGCYRVGDQFGSTVIAGFARNGFSTASGTNYSYEYLLFLSGGGSGSTGRVGHL